MATPLAVRVLEGHARSYRHTWRGTTVSAIATPVLFLAAMGLGLGTLVDEGTGGGIDGISYLAWLAPGLLSVSAMQNGAGDGAFPVLAGMRWVKDYHAAIATPVRPADLMLGNLAWATIRLAVLLTVFVAVAAAFGALPLGRGLLAVGPGLLVGVATCAVVSAFMASRKSDEALSGLFRFVIVPLFLFSGAFFPLDELPAFVQPLARINPVWHGVELSRATALVLPSRLAWPVHVGVLVLLLVGGIAWGVRSFTRSLRS